MSVYGKTGASNWFRSYSPHPIAHNSTQCALARPTKRQNRDRFLAELAAWCSFFKFYDIWNTKSEYIVAAVLFPLAAIDDYTGENPIPSRHFQPWSSKKKKWQLKYRQYVRNFDHLSAPVNGAGASGMGETKANQPLVTIVRMRSDVSFDTKINMLI